MKSVLRVSQNIYRLPATLLHVLNTGDVFACLRFGSRDTENQQGWICYLSERKEQTA